MLRLRPTAVRHASSTISNTRLAARQALADRAPLAPFPVIQTCPLPSCSCAEMPTGLDIDTKRDLNGSMSAYAQHLIISSGQADWTSRIEDERDTAPWGQFTADIKSALSRNGEFHDPYNNILVSTSSFASPEPPSPTASTTSEIEMLLFPSFQRILQPQTASSSTTNLIRNFLLPTTLHSSYDDLSPSEQQSKIRTPTPGPWTTSPITTPTILICSHNTRDSRCGILGPLLHAEFTRYISSSSSQAALTVSEHTFAASPPSTVNVGMISHIGGHKFAGNVIVYIPPTADESTTHPLAGLGVWYGRVQPSHVQGIVEETLRRGRVIRDLFRGAVTQNGDIVRL